MKPLKRPLLANLVLLAALALAHPGTSTAAEADDLPSGAVALGAGTLAQGTVGQELSPGIIDSVDWFEVDMTTDGYLSVGLSEDSGMGGVDVNVYRSIARTDRSFPAGDIVSTYDSPQDSLWNIALQTGKYQLRVTPHNMNYGGNKYSLRVAISSTPGRNDPEPNRTPASAQPLALDETVHGHLGFFGATTGVDGADWYTLELPHDTRLVVGAGVDSGALDITLELFLHVASIDSEQTGGVGMSTYNDPLDTLRADLVAGLYYVCVRRRSAAGSYSLRVQADQNPTGRDPEGTDYPAGSPILVEGRPLAAHIGYRGYPGGTDERDWFRLEVADSSDVHLALSGITKDLSLSAVLFDSVTHVDSANASGHDVGVFSNDSLNVRLGKGTYYLSVSIAYLNHGVGSYTLTYQNRSLHSGGSDRNDTPDSSRLSSLDTLLKTGAVDSLGAMNGPNARDSVDWWGFDVTDPHGMTLLVSLALQDVGGQIEVFGSESNGFPKAAPLGTVVASKDFSAKFPMGRYWMKVVWKSGSGSYSISMRRSISDAVDRRGSFRVSRSGDWIQFENQPSGTTVSLRTPDGRTWTLPLQPLPNGRSGLRTSDLPRGVVLWTLGGAEAASGKWLNP
ncbi:MAG: PPC domain-containing protein [Fibrobacteria bacterium]|nr:PPC domain-containing protein [Fibrobacteria bacterium]